MDGVLYELDGRKEGPVPHGPTSSATLLQDACAVVKQFMDRDPGELRRGRHIDAGCCACFGVLSLFRARTESCWRPRLPYGSVVVRVCACWICRYLCLVFATAVGYVSRQEHCESGSREICISYKGGGHEMLFSLI